MTTNNKGRAPGKDATPNEADHSGNHNASSPPRVSKYREKLIRRAMADAAERPLAIALLAALQSKGGAI